VCLVLDENGAEIQSEAEIETTVEEYEKPKPKEMIFDKPFLILLKRINFHKTNSYQSCLSAHFKLLGNS
jgi:hypothetical protein